MQAWNAWAKAWGASWGKAWGTKPNPPGGGAPLRVVPYAPKFKKRSRKKRDDDLMLLSK